MKSERGITLVSLMVYVTAMAMVILTVTNITRYFYANVTYTEDTTEYAEDYLKFTTHISEEINISNNTILQSGEIKENEGTENERVIQRYVIFSKTYNQYTFNIEENAIYKNQEKICENVEDCVFESQIENKFKVIITMKDMESPYTTTYTIRNY